MTNTNKLNFDKGMLKLVLVLFIVTLVTALLLGFVNYITKDKIAEAAMVKTASAMKEVLSADDYKEIGYTGGDSIVSGVYEASKSGELKGWVVQVKPSGFGGVISMVVGIDIKGSITGISIVSMTETSGLGANAAKESFKSQYVGKSGSVALSKFGGDIDALTAPHNLLSCDLRCKFCS
jgi:electron transport complex protein RnfG